MGALGGRYHAEGLTTPTVRPNTYERPKLTPREILCLQWCKEGKTNWEIGEILVISEKTVEFHLGNVMKKLGAANRITAVVSGLRDGFIPL
jgi:DNA-binding CsgD family transcriptional regulator